MGKYLAHQWAVNVAVNDGDELAGAGAMAWVGRLKAGTRECLVDVACDRAGLVDLKVIVNECRHTFEGMKREIASRAKGLTSIQL